MSTPSVVVVGDVAVDVNARHTGPIVPGDDTRANVITAPGGAAANTAVWLAHLGAAVTLVSRIGADLPGEYLRRGLTAAGVSCVFTVDPDAATGCVVVLVDEHGQRSMLSDRGANAALRPADLDPALLDGAAHLHLSGYVLLEPSRSAGVAALDAARRAGLSTSVDPQSANLITDPAAFVSLIRGVDLLLPNAEELAALRGLPAPSAGRRSARAAGRANRRPTTASGASSPALALHSTLPGALDAVGAVAVTSGAAGATWIDRDTTISVPAEPTECLDSTGAGDAFNGGLLAAWLTGVPPREALLAGVRAGTLATTKIGAWP